MYCILYYFTFDNIWFYFITPSDIYFISSHLHGEWSRQVRRPSRRCREIRERLGGRTSTTRGTTTTTTTTTAAAAAAAVRASCGPKDGTTTPVRSWHVGSMVRAWWTRRQRGGGSDRHDGRRERANREHDVHRGRRRTNRQRRDGRRCWSRTHLKLPTGMYPENNTVSSLKVMHSK
jgi:hypothetical protein